MLGIANPGLVSVDEIRNKSANFKGYSQYTDCKYCGHSHRKGVHPAFGKFVIKEKTTLNLNADPRPREDLASLSQSVTQVKGQMEPGRINVHAVYMKFMEVSIMIAQWRT